MVLLSDSKPLQHKRRSLKPAQQARNAPPEGRLNRTLRKPRKRTLSSNQYAVQPLSDQNFHSVTRRFVKTQPEFPEHFVGRRVLLEDHTLMFYTPPTDDDAVALSIVNAILGIPIKHLGRWVSGTGLQVCVMCPQNVNSIPSYTIDLSKEDGTDPTEREWRLIVRSFTAYNNDCIAIKKLIDPSGKPHWTGSFAFAPSA